MGFWVFLTVVLGLGAIILLFPYFERASLDVSASPFEEWRELERLRRKNVLSAKQAGVLKDAFLRRIARRYRLDHPFFSRDRQSTDIDSEKEIAAIIEEETKAIRAKDAEAVLARYAPEVSAFDLIAPLRYDGIDELRKRLQEWFSQFDGLLDYEVSNLKIVAGDEVAYCHSINHVSGTTLSENKIDMWWRATLCFGRIENRWLITHAHNSVPFDMQSGIASLDLKPE